MNYNKNEYLDLLDSFKNLNILVIGDLILDKYIQGSVKRISPEAPVPVVKVQKIENRIGGAGNVAANLTSLNCKVTICGICGNDQYGQIILDKFSELNINSLIIQTSDRPTTVKTRIIAQHQQVVRVDEEDDSSFSEQIHNQLINKIKNDKNNFDGIILSDYDKGLLTKEFIQKIENIFPNIPIIIDPIGHDYTKYSAATAIKPNWKEFKTAVNQPNLQIDHLKYHASKLIKKLTLKGIIITLGENGVFVMDDMGKSKILPTVARDVFDVSGAGDTFIATFTAGLLSSQNWLKASALANIASGIVVGKVGTAIVQYNEIVDNLHLYE